VVGTTTVNGALTVNNTAATGNLSVTGFANVSSTLNVVGATTVNGAVTINNTAATGNLTVTGFANVSTTLQTGSSANIGGALSVSGNTTFQTDIVFAVVSNTNIGSANTGGVFDSVEMIQFPLATYSGAKITAKATSTVAMSFNALTGVSNTTEYISTASHALKNNDVVMYLVSTGNTAITGISNGTSYYVINANTTALQLASTLGGLPLNLTAGLSQTGHQLVSNTAQVQELILAHNGNTTSQDVTLTVYGTVAAPATANLGVFTASINTTAVAVKFNQTRANTSVKLFTQLIK
jgi:hypothetical protein